MELIMLGEIPFKVKKRSHQTPKEINQYLKDKKNRTIKEITEFLEIPKTQTEHYFRVDHSRAIPSPTIWRKLKILLNLDNRHDKQVMEFYEKDQEYEMTKRLYSSKGIHPTLEAGQNLPHVLVTPKSTNTQYKYTKNTLEDNMKIKIVGNIGNGHEAQNVYDPSGIAPTVRENHGKTTKILLKDTTTMETAQTSTGIAFQTLIYWLEDFLAKLFQSQASEEALVIQEVRSSLKSLGVLGKSNHAFFCLRTLKGFYLTTKETRSLPSLPRWMSLGMTANGKLLTLKTSVSPKTGKECSLSDILEERVDQKYFLSESQTATLLGKLSQEVKE